MRQYGVRTALRSPGEAAGFLPGARQRPSHQWPPDRWTSHPSYLFLPFTFLPLIKFGHQQNHIPVLWKFGHQWPPYRWTIHLFLFTFSPLKFGQKENTIFVFWKFVHQWQVDKTFLTFPMHSILSSVQILSPIGLGTLGGNLVTLSAIQTIMLWSAVSCRWTSQLSPFLRGILTSNNKQFTIWIFCSTNCVCILKLASDLKL